MGKKLCPRSSVQPEGVITRAQFFSYTDRCKPVDIYFLFTGSLFFILGAIRTVVRCVRSWTSYEHLIIQSHSAC